VQFDALQFYPIYRGVITTLSKHQTGQNVKQCCIVDLNKTDITSVTFFCLYTEERSCNQRCCGKAESITYSECVIVALDIQHATRMRHTILTSVACLPVQYFPTLSHKLQYFREKDIGHKMSSLIFSTIFA
jgi:hypothetical protein